MNSKKILGVFLIILAIFLGLFALVSLPKIIGLLIGLFYASTGKTDAFTSGTVLGGLFYWALHFWALAASIKYARKNLRSQSLIQDETDQGIEQTNE